MNSFLINTIKFFMIFYGSLLGLIFTSNYFISENANFKLDNNIDKIIVGNSQPECAYNDSLINNFKNLSSSAETYFYIYQKLKKVVEQNPQLQSVFIEFNPTNILIREDQKIWRDRYINHHLPNYNAFLNLKDNKLLALKNIGGYQHAILKSLGYNIERIALNRYNYIDSTGGYLYLNRHKVNKILDTLTPKNFNQHQKENIKLSNYDILYLDKIVQLCKEKNIAVYLIRSPYHKQFIGNQYETVFQQIKTERFNDIKFLDFKDFPLENSEFGDLQHLNYKGARKFSRWFNENIIDSLKNESIKVN